MRRMKVRTIRDPETGKTCADVRDLIALFKDIREHPDKYDQDLVVTVIGQLAGKIPIEIVDRPF